MSRQNASGTPGGVALSCPASGDWLSWLERCLHTAEVTGSNPVSPTRCWNHNVSAGQGRFEVGSTCRDLRTLRWCAALVPAVIAPHSGMVSFGSLTSRARLGCSRHSDDGCRVRNPCPSMGTGTLPDGELSGWSSGTDSCRQSCAALFGPQHKVHHVSRIDSSMTGRYSGRPNVLIILAESISTKVPVASMKVSPPDEPEQVMVMRRPSRLCSRARNSRSACRGAGPV